MCGAIALLSKTSLQSIDSGALEHVFAELALYLCVFTVRARIPAPDPGMTKQDTGV
jgi:hypothetical protein